jgi:hypothetical protein
VASIHDTFARMSRDELVAAARSVGVQHPELMTRVELGDEILRARERTQPGSSSARGWLGVARDLLARLVERGLNLPNAAALIRKGPTAFVSSNLQAPVATVTLAEVYAAQGHVKRALAILDDVLQQEPDHAPARLLRERLARDHGASTPKPRESVPAESEPVDVDFVAIIASGADGAHVYWELNPGVERALRRRSPGGHAVIRVLVFVPDWGGAQRVEEEVPVTALRDSRWVGIDRPGTVVRAVLGWRSESGFRPVAVGMPLNESGDVLPGWHSQGKQAGAVGVACQRAIQALQSR